MKKALLLSLCLLFAQLSFGQMGQVGDTRWSMGISWDILDQFTPEIDGAQTFKAPMDMGLRMFTWASLNTSVAIELGVGTTGIRFRDIESPLTEKNLHLFNFDAGLVYKFNNGYIMKETSPVAPFLFVKARGTFMDLLKPGDAGQGMGFGLPLGGGINWRIADNIALNTAVAYTFGITDNYDNNLLYSIGIMFDLGDEKVIEVVIEPEPEIASDVDSDGIVDTLDECPQEPGLPEYLGCPDTDGDGIADKDDDCPTEFGLATFNGCPDSDGDGIRDMDDACPNVAGIAELRGCPNPDRDGDGIPDAVDKCPDMPGLSSLKGCPEVPKEVIEKLEFAAQNIQFELESAVLKPESNKILDEVVSVLKEHKNYSVKVEGHTDNTGSEAFNQGLSERRAKTAADYLVANGIDASRVVSAGFGESKPKADNATHEGRILNRRVEFNLFIP